MAPAVGDLASHGDVFLSSAFLNFMDVRVNRAPEFDPPGVLRRS